jgi:hypothetical protein
VVCVSVRPALPFPDGRKRPLRAFNPHAERGAARRAFRRVRLRRAADPQALVAANVFADWLEERGFAEAGRALRVAFPLSPL